MGGVLNACKSTLSKTVRSTPETINETHLENDDKVYQHQREFEDAFLHNTEDLIQEITTNSQWQHHETRYLLSQFRKLGQKKDATNLTTQQFTQFLPILLKSFLNIKDKQEFQQNKFYAKWLRNFIKIFSTNNDQITFQSFANTLSTACRGEASEKAKLLFEIFDIDGDGTFNQTELDLFLYYILNIDCIGNGTETEPETEGNDLNTNTNTNKGTNNFDINKIIIKSKFVEYIQELTSPPPQNQNETKENDQTVTNGQNSQKHHDDDDNDNDDDEHKDKDQDENKDPDIANKDNNSSSKSSDKLDSEWEKLPLKKENVGNNETLRSDKEDIVITNIDFVANMSINDLKNADDATLADILKKLFKDKLFKKNKLKQKVFLPFASRAINFDNLFQSFMIIPTRDDEKEIIKHLMQSTETTLGTSWFVINKEWWDKWCSYTGYDEETNSNTEHTENKQNGDGIIDASVGAKKRALRPIKISNRELLDSDSFFTVLKKSLQENNEFILLPSGAWEQLLEWYGGGPSIERFVICTDKKIRMKVIEYETDKLKYEYEQHLLANSEAMKKKKKKNKKKDNDKDKDKDKDDDTDSDDKGTDKNGIFDIAKFNKEFPAKLQELSFSVHADTLRVDLHPIYCNFVEINEKNEITDHSEREFSISRYATLPELYINICARIGYQIRDISIPKRNYNAYLQHKLHLKTTQRENDKTKKKDKKKNKDNDTANIALPPRMWTVIRPQRGRPSTDRLLYPVPKLNTKPAAEEKKTDDANHATPPKASAAKPDTNSHHPTDDSPDNTDPNTKPADTTNDAAANTEEEDEDEIDLQTIGLESGVYIAIEFAHSNKKKGGVLKYNLRSAAEDLVCEPEIDDSWLEFAVDDNIDGRDRWGKWYEAVIVAHKQPNEAFPKKPKLSKAQEKDVRALQKLEALFIHYKAWEEKWDEWIFLTPGETICGCRQACTYEKTKHRLAPPKTQSKYREERKRAGGHYGGGRRSGSYGGGWGRPRESIRGAPSTAGCVGLVNLGNTCFMNSIIQCVSNTPHFRTFFTSGQYKPDINKSNPLGMKGELANEFSKLLSDIWSGDYKTVAPRSLKRALSKFAPQFSGWQQHDSHEFLAFLLDGLHEDLNLVKSKPYTDKIESQGRADDIVADLSWKIYLKRNKSKIVDLFQAQQRSHVICPDCNRNSITFDTYMYLSVPIVGHSSKSLVVDVFHRRWSNAINKPIRHVFHVNKYQKVRDLAKMVANVYDTKEQFVLFYENWNMKVAREFDHNLMLGMVPNKDALACYILKDWNKVVTPTDIKKKKLSLMLAKLCHSAPPKTVSNGSPLFGMPFVVSFLNIHTRREVHKVIYERLFMWVGCDTLSKKPPSFDKLEQEETEKGKGKEAETDPEKKKNDGDEDEDEDIEKQWDEIFENLPYTLRLVPYKHYSFYSSNSRNSAPEEIAIDDVIFESKIRTKDIDIIIEWKKAETYNNIKIIVNKVVVDKDYSEWKKQKAIQQQRSGGKQEALTLDDCINAYVAQETLGDNDLWYCSECKKHEKANKKLDLWSFPEILIIHLKRFQVLGIGRFGRGEKINTFVDCPIRGLDLTQYVIHDGSSTAPIYDLYAVSCHSGSCGGGHYTAYALNAKTDRWYYFNDSSVRPAKESDIVSSSSYVLFYKKCH